MSTNWFSKSSSFRISESRCTLYIPFVWKESESWMVAWYFLSPTVWIFLKWMISISFVFFISNRKVDWANDNLMFLMVHFENLAWVLCDRLNNSRFSHFRILSMCNSELQKVLIFLCTKRKMTRNQLVQSGMKTSHGSCYFAQKWHWRSENRCLNLGKAHSTPHSAQYSHLDRLQAEKFN